MDIAQFKAGSIVKQPTGYRSFIPQTINETYTWNDASINVLLEKATLQLGALNSFSQFVPDIDLFIRMHVVKEATESSRIEGIRTNIEEALVKAADLIPEKRDDWQEVNNYVRAMTTPFHGFKHCLFHPDCCVRHMVYCWMVCVVKPSCRVSFVCHKTGLVVLH